MDSDSSDDEFYDAVDAPTQPTKAPPSASNAPLTATATPERVLTADNNGASRRRSVAQQPTMGTALKPLPESLSIPAIDTTLPRTPAIKRPSFEDVSSIVLIKNLDSGELIEADMLFEDYRAKGGTMLHPLAMQMIRRSGMTSPVNGRRDASDDSDEDFDAMASEMPARASKRFRDRFGFCDVQWPHQGVVQIVQAGVFKVAWRQQQRWRYVRVRVGYGRRIPIRAGMRILIRPFYFRYARNASKENSLVDWCWYRS
jgi:hypothetical protein